MESNAATAIQRVYRGHRVRRIGRTLHTAATTIQAAFRGFLNRKRFSLIIQTNREIEDHEYRLHSIQSRLSRHEKDMQLLKGTHREKISQVSLEWLNKAATVVQKVYRGYYTRKMLKGVNHQGKRKTLSTRRTPHPRPKQTVKFESDTINDLEESDIEASHQDIVATSDEGDIAVAREQVIHRLETVRQSKNTHKERETAANLLANLNIAQRLLNNYYDSVDDSDFCVDNTLKFSPQDITLGCKSLRLRTEDYLEALLGEYLRPLSI
ncbi:hypothetical protein BCR33DRAFT_763479 [Rhizoclosmatium globosum]|uniref:IQ motif, EF-hand binding site n=1 Tax=Rhizoclosmatium globosum TaxID=329046 RepID=A0A1Y2CPN8_9FUNG|nr:hypothetical protein BCR33DRAFT_763479 [Rhizoclosmatium globosum]|eukprot:ORY49019.1 hypothetical protein BCR33DRAFT_763479 [Rhizoclosmatium globosum]